MSLVKKINHSTGVYSFFDSLADSERAEVMAKDGAIYSATHAIGGASRNLGWVTETMMDHAIAKLLASGGEIVTE